LSTKDQVSLHNTIVKFFGAEQLKWNELNEDSKQPLDSGAKFSMKDVMELTLLHAQQMQVLSDTYEKRMKTMDHEMRDSEHTHNRHAADLLHQLDLATGQIALLANELNENNSVRAIHKILKEEDNGSNSNVSGAIKSISNRGEQNSNARFGGEFGPSTGTGAVQVKSTSPYSQSVTSLHRIKTKSNRHGRSNRVANKRNKKLKNRMRKKQKQFARVHKKKGILPLHPRKLPVFTGKQFEMTFLQRLKWFTRTKLQNYIDLANEVKRQQSDATELRLTQAGRLDGEGLKPVTTGAEFTATFMPAPGSIPATRKEGTTTASTAGPWGGKFIASPVGRTQSCGVINLFEMALTTKDKRGNVREVVKK